MIPSRDAASLVERTTRLIKLCGTHGIQFTCVESCTGGLLQALCTSVPGSSRAFWGGWVTYADDAKTQLGVSQVELSRVGAVSSEIALEMARCGQRQSGAALCVSITGIAGPDGGSADKPVGTVWFATADDQGEARSEKRLFGGTREEVRAASCGHALAMLETRIQQYTAFVDNA